MKNNYRRADDYQRARWEHALFLRTQGLKWREIGERLGVGTERARQMAVRQERIERYALDYVVYVPELFGWSEV